MSVAGGPDMIQDGLVLSLNAADRNSYPGSGTVWTDLSGNGNNGTLTNGPTFSSANGGSIVFDGTNDYVVNSNYGLTGLSSITLSSWANFQPPTSTVLPNIGCIVAGGGISSRNFQMAVSNGSPFGTVIEFYSVGTGEYFSNSTTTTGWHNYLITYSGGNLSFYKDGSLINTTTGLAALNTGTEGSLNLQIGSDFYSTYFKGNIPSVQIYNRALSASEVAQNYNSTKTRFGL